MFFRFSRLSRFFSLLLHRLALAFPLTSVTAAVFLAAGMPLRSVEPPKLKVCASVTDLGELCKEVGGDEVAVTVFAKGPQDPHFLEAKPSFIKELSGADLFVLVGLDLETAWASGLWQNARNSRVLPGALGFLDASRSITPLEAPAGIVDRALGDVHPYGNPHYLSDPVNGLKVARAVRDRLAELRPQKREYFASRYEAFASRLRAALVGVELASRYDAEKLAMLAEHGKLGDFLEKQGAARLLGGWLGRLAPYRGAKVVSDHNLWPYFARRFGLEVVGFMEPKPGIAPTTRHLGMLVEKMKSHGVRVVLSVPYFDARHARFLSEKTGARVLALAHHCGARPGTEDYLSMVEYNVRQLEGAFKEAR